MVLVVRRCGVCRLRTTYPDMRYQQGLLASRLPRLIFAMIAHVFGIFESRRHRPASHNSRQLWENCGRVPRATARCAVHAVMCATQLATQGFDNGIKPKTPCRPEVLNLDWLWVTGAPGGI